MKVKGLRMKTPRRVKGTPGIDTIKTIFVYLRTMGEVIANWIGKRARTAGPCGPSSGGPLAGSIPGTATRPWGGAASIGNRTVRLRRTASLRRRLRLRKPKARGSALRGRARQAEIKARLGRCTRWFNARDSNKSQGRHCLPWLLLVHPTGIEPATSGFGGLSLLVCFLLFMLHFECF